jgi:flagellin FlaB
MKISKKGETGIGTLIVFIAMILVAAIAASVLLGTAGSLQQKSLTTGKQTQQEVSSGIQVVTLTGTNGIDGTVEAFEMLIKLTAGSDALALNDTLITFDTKTQTQNIRYCGTYDSNESAQNSSQGYCNESASNGVGYSAEYLKNGTDHLVNYLTTGDIVKIRYNSTSSISQSATVKLRVIPKHGVIVPVDFVTPDVISTQRVILYP